MTKDSLTTLQAILGAEYGLPPEALVPEFFDFLKVVAMGAKKYEMNNWLRKDGKNSNERAMADSMFHHLAESFVEARNSYLEHGKVCATDSESGLDPLLHLATRALMLHTRRQRTIIHPQDEIK